MELRDKNGLTEAEFLARYDASKFERPSVTVDIILFRGDSVLLIRRAGHPSIGKLAFPGGFVDPNETVEAAARRELWEETHVKDILCKQLPVQSKPDRDPRTRIITVPFLACMLDETQEAKADDDASEAKFWNVSAKDDGKVITFTLSREGTSFSFEVERYTEEGMFPGVYSYRVVGGEPLAGDHGEILARAWEEREKIKSSKN